MAKKYLIYTKRKCPECCEEIPYDGSAILYINGKTKRSARLFHEECGLKYNMRKLKTRGFSGKMILVIPTHPSHLKNLSPQQRKKDTVDLERLLKNT